MLIGKKKKKKSVLSCEIRCTSSRISILCKRSCTGVLGISFLLCAQVGSSWSRGSCIYVTCWDQWRVWLSHQIFVEDLGQQCETISKYQLLTTSNCCPSWIPDHNTFAQDSSLRIWQCKIGIIVYGQRGFWRTVAFQHTVLSGQILFVRRDRIQ
jgi:hypothetical protein